MSNPGSRYVRLLQQTKGQNLNNGTVAGGLAHALTQGLRGYATRKADEEEQEKARQREQQIAGYLTGVNQRAMGNDGPTQEAAARAPIPDPEGLASMFADRNMAPFAAAEYGRMMAPAPERYEDVLDEQGRVIGQRSSVSDRLAPVPANPYAPKPPPAGWQVGDDGRMTPIPGGPADPAYMAQTRAPKQLSPRDAAFASLSPEEQRDILLKSNQTNITLPSTTQETEQMKARGKGLANRFFETIQPAADNARQQMYLLQQAKNLSSSALPDDYMLAAGNFARAMGFSEDMLPTTITNGQQFESVMQSIVLDALAAQKGPQTDKDADRIKKTVASLRNTPEARGYIIDSAMAMNQMKVLKEQFWEQHWADNQTYDGASASWNRTFGQAPLVGRNPNSGRTVFFPQFIEAQREDNPEMPMTEILEIWKRKYE